MLREKPDQRKDPGTFSKNFFPQKRRYTSQQVNRNELEPERGPTCVSSLARKQGVSRMCVKDLARGTLTASGSEWSLEKNFSLIKTGSLIKKKNNKEIITEPIRVRSKRALKEKFIKVHRL